jgi:Domain of unknown function (DUF4386)
MNATRAMGTPSAVRGRDATSSDRRTAAIIGVLFIVGDLAGVMSVVALGDVVTRSSGLVGVATHEGRVVTASLLAMVMVFALAFIPIAFYPVGRRRTEALAIGYVVFRGAIETVLGLGTVVTWLWLVALARADAPTDPATAAPLFDLTEVLSNQLLAIPFGVGAVLFSAALLRGHLVPPWLAWWGVVGGVAYLGAPMLDILNHPFGVLMAPLALQELVLAVWLLVRGFPRTWAEGP